MMKGIDDSFLHVTVHSEKFLISKIKITNFGDEELQQVEFFVNEWKSAPKFAILFQDQEKI